MSQAAGWVLVVEDDEDIRDIVKLVLESRGYPVAVAADGVEALGCLRGRPRPSVILLDVMMPRMNGVELVRVLRADPVLAQIAVVVMSGDGRARETAAAIAAADLLSKPIDLEDLVAAVRRFAGPPPEALPDVPLRGDT